MKELIKIAKELIGISEELLKIGIEKRAEFFPEEWKEYGFTPETAKDEIRKEGTTLTEKLLKLKKLSFEQTEDDIFQKWVDYVSKKLTEWNLNLTMENIRRILSLTKTGRDLYEKSPAKFEKFVKRIYNILSEKGD